MNCSCNANAKVKPTEFCIYCVHKHLSTALSLTEFIKKDICPIDYRIAAQVNLAMLHLLDKADSYEKEIKLCKDIITNTVDKNVFIKDLEQLTSHFWKSINESRTSLNEKESYRELSDSTIEFAILKISVAIELMKYEPSYESVNYSTAIGQIVNASWTLNNIDKQLAEQCRSIYHSIENKDIDISKIESFRGLLISYMK